MVDDIVRSIESGLFLPHSGIRFPQDPCTTCPFLGLCLKGLELAKLARHQGQRFESATWLHRARQMPKAEFQREVEKGLTGKDCEPSELIFFKVYKSEVPVIERAIETAALMLGSDKSRGYCLKMICADFLAGASIAGDNPEALLQSISRYYQFLPPLTAGNLFI
ncbi:MAG: hypothetical protein P4M04_06040 [Acidobacteriota bacterium]|nr:hypothetical protein [Acidobacteriota bacterium]